KKDMIKSGGVGVYPRDIEEVLVTHPAVKEAVVFGIADPKWGETPVAALVLKEGAAATGAELREWANKNVSAKFQRVSDVFILESLPKNAAGKVLKREIRANYLDVKGSANL
ncbi:MAG: AMP-binding enzyme, partial [Burkholderiales bacterium]